MWNKVTGGVLTQAIEETGQCHQGEIVLLRGRALRAHRAAADKRGFLSKELSEAAHLVCPLSEEVDSGGSHQQGLEREQKKESGSNSHPCP